MTQTLAVLAVLGVDGLMCRFSNVLFLFCCNSYTVAQIQAQVANGTSLYHAALQRSPYNEIVPSNRDLNNRLSHSGKRTIEAMSEEVRVSLLLLFCCCCCCCCFFVLEITLPWHYFFGSRTHIDKHFFVFFLLV